MISRLSVSFLFILGLGMATAAQAKLSEEEERQLKSFARKFSPKTDPHTHDQKIETWAKKIGTLYKVLHPDSQTLSFSDSKHLILQSAPSEIRAHIKKRFNNAEKDSNHQPALKILLPMAVEIALQEDYGLSILAHNLVPSGTDSALANPVFNYVAQKLLEMHEAMQPAAAEAAAPQACSSLEEDEELAAALAASLKEHTTMQKIVAHKKERQIHAAEALSRREMTHTGVTTRHRKQGWAAQEKERRQVLKALDRSLTER